MGSLAWEQSGFLCCRNKRGAKGLFCQACGLVVQNKEGSMSDDRNIFGGKNPNFAYTPMSEDEQEVLDRLVDARDLSIKIVNVHGQGQIDKIVKGDLNLSLYLTLLFLGPEIHIPIPYLELELRTLSGMLLYGAREPLNVGNSPLIAGKGSQIQFVWKISIRKMDPDFVKMMKPGARGLTSRLGNMHLTEKEASVLHKIHQGEKRVGILKQERLRDLSKKTS